MQPQNMFKISPQELKNQVIFKKKCQNYEDSSSSSEISLRVFMCLQFRLLFISSLFYYR